ncbi:MAG TPA: hypothetical protein VKD91_13315, partial [Pyrinomonadaceae bacterium]|nr:hypothetical protein [Pyrinomonadaceae bacterium]
AYRRDANGNWSKWENGGWNNVQKPGNSARDSMLNDSARQRERQDRLSGNSGNRDGARGDRAGSGSRPQTLDRSTYNGLNRDMGARREGNQRARDQNTFRSQSRPSAGSYRGGGGGMSRGGGGGFRGGGGRRR